MTGERESRGLRPATRAALELVLGGPKTGQLLAESAEAAATVAASQDFVLWMARLTELSVSEGGDRPANAGTDVTTAGAVFLPFAAETDPAKLRASLEKKLDKLAPASPAGQLANLIRDFPGLDFIGPKNKVQKQVLSDLTFELNFTKGARIDMCQTCHMASDRAGFTEDVIVDGEPLDDEAFVRWLADTRNL